MIGRGSTAIPPYYRNPRRNDAEPWSRRQGVFDLYKGSASEVTMRLTPLNYLILVLNAAIDGGAIAAMDELLKRIENETLFPWLAEKYRGYMDLSLLDEAERR